MPAIQFKNASANKNSPKVPVTPQPMIPTQQSQQQQEQEHEFTLPQLRKNRFHIQIEWVRHSRPACSIYLAIGVLLTTYYAACFITQYGTFDRIVEIKPVPCLQESVLTRLIMIEWLLLAAVLLLGMTIFRRIFMPLYIYLAVMATNGTLVLFVVKFKQFTEGKIPHDDLSLNLVGILLVTATAHNLVYLYAMHLHLNSRSYSRIHRPAAATAAPQAVAAPSQNEGKKDLSGLP